MLLSCTDPYARKGWSLCTRVWEVPGESRVLHVRLHWKGKPQCAEDSWWPYLQAEMEQHAVCHKCLFPCHCLLWLPLLFWQEPQVCCWLCPTNSASVLCKISGNQIQTSFFVLLRVSRRVIIKAEETLVKSQIVFDKNQRNVVTCSWHRYWVFELFVIKHMKLLWYPR